jgi:hypothetical protein
VAHYLVLFFCVWCLYTGDRLIDVLRIRAGDPSPGLKTERHRFISRLPGLFGSLFFFSGFLGGLLGITQMERPIFGAGLIVLVGAVAYFLTFVSPLGGKKPLPGKEVAGGLLFAAGTTLPVFADYDGSLSVIPSFAIFAGLCALNLLMIASREGDLPGGRAFGWLLGLLGAGLTLTASGFAIFGTETELQPLFLFQALAGAALTILQLSRNATSQEAFRVFADLVLLTPLIPVARLIA